MKQRDEGSKCQGKISGLNGNKERKKSREEIENGI